MKIFGLNIYKQPFLKWLSIFVSSVTRNRLIRAYFAGERCPKLQIGCGYNFLPGWLNSDFIPGKGVIHIDATKKLPFPDACFDCLFTEHMIEHIPVVDAASFLAECHRILKSGGTLRVSTPNIQFLKRLWTEPQDEVIRKYCEFAVATFVKFPKIVNPCVVINNFFYSWGHRFIFDEETLIFLLKEAGFAAVLRCEVGRSAHSELNNIEKHGSLIGDDFNRLETLVLEATK